MTQAIHPRPGITLADVAAVSPALAHVTQTAIADDLWSRPALAPRDRALVTLAALVARNVTIGVPHYTNLALDRGVTPGELSELVTHLAFYAGWSNAFAAVPFVRDVFAQRGIGADQLAPIAPDLLPLDEAAESRRAAHVDAQFGAAFPGLVRNTTALLFRDLWLRPGLAPRDRSLITVAALIAAGQVAQLPYHLNRALDHGVTREQAAEAVTHLAFYAGWPCAFAALPVVQDVFAQRDTA
jgi:4-carboxymuconolactone decarboxylase